jgi:translocation and assembly module TamB
VTNARNTISKHLRVSRPVRLLAYVFGAALLLYLGAVAILSTVWFNRALLERTREQLARVTGTRVEIAQIRVEPWIFQVSFRGLVLHGDESPGEEPLLAVQELMIQVNPVTAFRRGLWLWGLHLEGAQAHIYTRADGSTNLPGPATHTEGLAALDDLVNLRIHQLLVIRSGLYWDQRPLALDLGARNVAVLLGYRRGRYTGAVSASPLDATSMGLHLPPLTVSTRLEIAKNTLVVNSLVWRSAVFSGSGGATFHWLPAVGSQFSFQIEGEAGALIRLLGHDEVQGGRLATNGQGTYLSGSFSVDGRIDARRLVVHAPNVRPFPADFAADFALNRGRVSFSRVIASLFGGVARGKADVSFEAPSPQFKADLEIQNVDVAAAIGLLPSAAAVLRDFPVSSRAGGRVQFSTGGKAAVIQTAFDLRFEAVMAPVASREPLSGLARGTATLGRGVSLDLDEVALQSSHSSATLRGQLSEVSPNLAFQVRTTDFEEWRSVAEAFAEAPLPVKLDSTAIFSGTVSGTLAQPLVRGKLQVGAFEYAGWKWTGLDTGVTAAPSQLQVTDAHLEGPHSLLTFDMTSGLVQWQFAPDSPLQLSARSQQTSLQGLREVLGITYPIGGQLTGEFTLNRTRAQLVGDGRFHIAQGSYGDETFDSLDVSLRTASGVWKLTSVRLSKGHGKMTGEGTYDPHDHTLSAHAQGSGFSLDDFNGLRKLTAISTTTNFLTNVAGTVDFDVQAHGALDAPTVQGNLAIRGLRATDTPLGDFTSKLDWNGRDAKMEGQLAGPAGDLKLYGTGTTEGQWPLSLTVHYSSLRLDPWLRALGYDRAGGNLQVTGSLDLSATARAATPLRLKGTVQKLEASFAELKWQNDHPFEIALVDRQLTIAPFQMEGPSTLFQFQGTASLASPSALDLSANGQIDSALLHVFDSAILTTGHFDVKLSVKGSLNQPSVFGTLHVDQVSLGYPGIPLRLTGLSGDVDLLGDRLQVRSLHAESGPASASITGSVTLSGTPRSNLRAELHHIRVEYPVQFTSVLSGAVHLTGSASAGVLSGDLTVEQMFVGNNFNILSWASQLQSQSSIAAATPAALPSGIRLDLHLVSAPTVSVESRDFNAVAAIDMALRGTLTNPVGFGSIHIQSGQAVLRQTTYTLSRGDIIMANPLETEPVLDLQATTRIDRYDLTLRVTGPADRPNINYRSEPPLSTPSILALLAFGYSSQDQLLEATGRSAFGTESASVLLSQALSNQTTSRITRLFGVSRIGIDPNPSSVGGSRVTVVERLGNNFTVTYVTTTGGVYQRIVQMEWDLTNRMSLLAVRDQNGVYGFELDFRRRFK